MLTIFFYGLTVLQVVLLVVGVRLYLRQRNWYALLTLLPIVGLVYDNLVVALGTSIGEGDLLLALNAGRFWLHALITPVLAISAFGIARRVGLGWAQSRRNHALICVLALGLILYGSYGDILRLTLEPRLENGLLRYVNVGVKGPPVASILTIIVLIVVGVQIWRRGKSPGMAGGSILMFIAAGAGASVFGVGNLGEVFMMAGMLDGERVAQQQGAPVAEGVVPQRA